MKKLTKTISTLMVTGYLLAGCSANESQTQMPNPVKEVESSSSFSALEINLEAPNGATEISYSIISKNLAQVKFVSGEMPYILRASKVSDDISGVYDPFKNEPIITPQEIKSGELVEITTKRTADGGHVASWSYNDITFCLVNLDLMEDSEFISFVCLVCEYSCDLN